MHWKFLKELLIESMTTLGRSEVSLTEAVTCGSGSCLSCLIGEFTFTATIDFNKVSSDFQRTRFFSRQTFGLHKFPHLFSYPVILPSKIDKFPFIYESPFIKLTAWYM